MVEKKSILFADDDESIRQLCGEALVEEGYDVILARDGREAIKKAEQKDPDLVILDVQMSRMDGLEALPKILRKKRNTPVILYSAYPRHQEEFMTWVADAYVVKSSDLGELKKKIEELLSPRQANRIDRTPQ